MNEIKLNIKEDAWGFLFILQEDRILWLDNVDVKLKFSNQPSTQKKYN